MKNVKTHLYAHSFKAVFSGMLLSIMLLFSCSGCRSGKNRQNSSIVISNENQKLLKITNTPISSHMHPDSAKAVNERVLSEVKNKRLSPIKIQNILP